MCSHSVIQNMLEIKDAEWKQVKKNDIFICKVNTEFS